MLTEVCCRPFGGRLYHGRLRQRAQSAVPSLRRAGLPLVWSPMTTCRQEQDSDPRTASGKARGGARRHGPSGCCPRSALQVVLRHWRDVYFNARHDKNMHFVPATPLLRILRHAMLSLGMPTSAPLPSFATQCFPWRAIRIDVKRSEAVL